MNKKLKSFIIIILLLILFFLIKSYATDIFSNLEIIKKLILNTGFLSPLFVILLQIIQGMTSFFPDSAVIIASGYIFGIIPGIIYNSLGEITSAILFYFIAKKYGKRLFINKQKTKIVKDLKKTINKKGKYILFILRLIPVFPNNLINFTAGWANMKFSEVLLFNILAIVPYTALFAIFGEKIQHILTNNIFFSLAFIIITIMCIAYVFRNEIKDKIINH